MNVGDAPEIEVAIGMNQTNRRLDNVFCINHDIGSVIGIGHFGSEINQNIFICIDIDTQDTIRRDVDDVIKCGVGIDVGVIA